jgi:hypothetical protein
MYPLYASGGHHICKPCDCGSVTHAWRTTDRVAKSYTRVVFTSPCRPASISSARAVGGRMSSAAGAWELVLMSVAGGDDL